MTFDVHKTDTLGQLRADVCDRLQGTNATTIGPNSSGDGDSGQMMVDSAGSTDALLKIMTINVGPSSRQQHRTDVQSLRLLFGGRELLPAWDDRKLDNLCIKDAVTLSALFSSRSGDNIGNVLSVLSGVSGSSAVVPANARVTAAPDKEASPMLQLLRKDYWHLLNAVIDRLFQCAAKVSEYCIYM
jgi:hypothetical protein